MHNYTIINNNISSKILYGKHITSDINHVFYSPITKKHDKMKIIYLYYYNDNDNNDNNDNDNIANYISWDDNIEKSKLVGSFYVFKDYIEPFNLKKLYISYNDTHTNPTMKISETKPVTSTYTSCWVFKNAKIDKLYPLAAIVWPPAQKYFGALIEGVIYLDLVNYNRSVTRLPQQVDLNELRQKNPLHHRQAWERKRRVECSPFRPISRL